MIEIIRAAPHLLVQDSGFSGCREMGLPRAGAMDTAALHRGNALAGNPACAPALEWALSGGVVRFECDVTITLTGARLHGRLGNQMLSNDQAYDVRAGSTLDVDRITSGRFLYLCICPALDIPLVLGSRSTYAPAAIGGFHGRRLKNGDRVPMSTSPTAHKSEIVSSPDYSASVIHIVRGPQADVLGGRLLEFLIASEFMVSRSSDRTGYRLDGPAAPVEGLTQILSEPACEGAIQITDGGTPIVLMADGPTIGGYNKVAVVADTDLPVLAQKTPGERIQFTLR